MSIRCSILSFTYPFLQSHSKSYLYELLYLHSLGFFLLDPYCFLLFSRVGDPGLHFGPADKSSTKLAMSGPRLNTVKCAVCQRFKAKHALGWYSTGG